MSEFSIKDFQLLANPYLPLRDDDGSSSTKVEVYFILDWVKGNQLQELAKKDHIRFEGQMSRVFDLEEEPEYAISPGGVYHRYSFEVASQDILIVFSTTALNV